MKTLCSVVLVFCILLGCKSELNWRKRVTNLEGLSTIKSECLKFESELENSAPLIKLGKDTSVAPQYFDIRLYPPISLQELVEIEEEYSIDIPKPYAKILTQLNGAFFYGISLYGFSDILIKRGLINRHEPKPLNLYLANHKLKQRLSVNQKLFLIGGSQFTDFTNIYYFLNEEKVVSYLNDGTKLNEWSSIDEMLRSELQRLRKYSD